MTLTIEGFNTQSPSFIDDIKHSIEGRWNAIFKQGIEDELNLKIT